MSHAHKRLTLNSCRTGSFSSSLASECSLVPARRALPWAKAARWSSTSWHAINTGELRVTCAPKSCGSPMTEANQLPAGRRRGSRPGGSAGVAAAAVPFAVRTVRPGRPSPRQGSRADSRKDRRRTEGVFQRRRSGARTVVCQPYIGNAELARQVIERVTSGPRKQAAFEAESAKRGPARGRDDGGAAAVVQPRRWLPIW